MYYNPLASPHLDSLQPFRILANVGVVRTVYALGVVDGLPCSYED
jgi:hypothetical protein